MAFLSLTHMRLLVCYSPLKVEMSFIAFCEEGEDSVAV